MTDDKIVQFPQRPKGTPVDELESRWVDQMRSMLAGEKLHDDEAKAIVDEEEFRRRFRAPWPRRDREALLDFQRANNLSDHDIRWLMRSKSLEWRRGRIEVLDPFWMRLSGWLHIGAIWFVLGISMLHGAHLARYSDRAIVLLAAGSLALLFVSRFFWLLFLLPHRVRMKAQKLKARPPRVARRRPEEEPDVRRVG